MGVHIEQSVIYAGHRMTIAADPHRPARRCRLATPSGRPSPGRRAAPLTLVNTSSSSPQPGDRVCAPATALAAALLAWPWLSPWAWGPSAQVMPWLVSLVCGVLAWVALGRSGELPRVLALGWAMAAVGSAGIGLIQYGGLVGHLPPALAAMISSAAPGEAFGNLRQPNQFASLMQIGLLALAWLLASSPAGSSSRALVLLAAAGAAVLLQFGNVASGSRTGLAELVLLAVLALLWRGAAWRSLLPLVLVSALAYALAAWLLPLWSPLPEAGRGVALSRLQGDAGCSSRLVLWSNVLALIAQQPWTGWGWGQLDRAHFLGVFDTRFCDILDHAHNLPLHLAVELGVPAALLACALMVWGLWRGRPWAARDADRQLAWGVLAVIGLHSMVEHPLWYGPFVLATVGAASVLLRASGLRLPLLRDWRARALAALLPLAVVLHAAHDYERVSQLYMSPLERSPRWRADPIGEARKTFWFRDIVDFAELTTTELTPANAQTVHDLASRLLAYSPEPRVIEKLLDSALLLGRDAEVLLISARYRAAFPAQWQAWRERLATPDNVALR